MRIVVPATAVVLLAGTAVPAAAQEYARKSQRAIVSQTVNTTTISVSYGRPSVRGRVLFGTTGIIHHSPWAPGADEATVVEFSKDVWISGEALPAGRYGLWFRPDRTPWSVIFTSRPDVWHVPYRAGNEVLELELSETVGEHTELLTFGFPMVTTDSTILRFAWGTTRVDLPIRVARELEERP